MLRKFFAVIISISIMSLSVIIPSSAEVSDEAAVTDSGFAVITSASASPQITGDATKGYTSSLPTDAVTTVKSKTPYAMANALFDLSLPTNSGSYGYFGISKVGDLEEYLPKSDAKNISFYYLFGGGESIKVYLASANGDIEIGNLSNVGNDSLWHPSVLQIGFARSADSWYLSVNGTLCNNVSENTESSKLEKYFGKAFFENKQKGYFYYGSNAVGGGVNSYFKPTVTVGDSWSTVAENRYFSQVINGTRYDWRGAGVTSETVFSSFPSVTGSREEGHIVDFTSAQGYAQSVNGFDLKATKFYIAPFKENASDWENVFEYYLGFTTNPTQLKGKASIDSRVRETIELAFQSVNSANQTYFYPFTYTNKALPIGEMNNHNYHSHRDGVINGSTYYKTAPVIISFKKAAGYNNEEHWYMHVNVFGTVRTVCNTSNEEADKSVRFDDIIDKPVYARLGTCGAGSFGGKMFIKASVWHEADTSADSVNAAAIALKESLLNGFADTTFDKNEDGKLNICDVLTQHWLSEGVDCINNVTDLVHVSSYGAAGDGITDDGAAITAAVNELKAIGKDAVLVFEKNKTYYCDKGTESVSDFKAVFKIDGGENLNISGLNTRIVTEAENESRNSFMYIKNTKNFTVKGISFTYGTLPFFLATNAVNTDKTNNTCVMNIADGVAEDYLGLTEIGQTVSVPTNGNSSLAFGIIEESVGRKHMFIDRYELVDTDKIKIYFNSDANAYTATWMDDLATKKLICPTPRVGHYVEYAAYVYGNENISFKDVNLYSVCRFAFVIIGTEGTANFDNVNIIPDPELEGTAFDTDFSAWRDGWHLKENRAGFNWSNCKATGLQDDIYNISSASMYVKDIQTIRGVTNYFLYWQERNGGTFHIPIKSGDKMLFINRSTGKIIGETTVKSVVKQADGQNVVTLNENLSGITDDTNTEALFPDYCAPGSTIANCNFNGTLRFRGPLTVTDTYIYCRRMHLDVYRIGDFVIEGPVPQNILFKGCTFDFDNATSEFIHASAYNSNTSDESYHVKNIVFENCSIRQSAVEIGTGDQVIFK